ncbi:MAG: glycosyltransferase family 2 protein [Patescibacteria group bacterium]|jgi:cellulose synthase/poly-beta-1,6-N-acetylglucosamine synthase-like glycosyltransferase
MSTYGKNRIWEIFPGALVWTTLILAIVLSFVAPIIPVVFIIVFDLYWFFRIVYFAIFMLLSWREYKHAIKYDWFADLQKQNNWQRLHHLIFLPTYKESTEIIRETLRSIAATHYPKDKMIIVLAGEGRDHERFQKNAAIISQEFSKTFKKIIVTEHPVGLPDEIPGKGSNLNYSGHEVKKILASEFSDIPAEDIIVSSFDVDTVVHPSYFACLSYLYLTSPNPTHASYQPVVLFSNNIWTSRAPVRIAAFGTVFWLLTELARSDRLWTFSSHSMPWKMLVDVDFWQKDIVSEDSRIFLQAFLKYHGDYRVVPMFLPVSMDTVVGANYWESLKALYKQQRRWAWGVEHFPVMVDAFKKDKLIPLNKKIKYLFNHIEGMYTWATAPILIFALGYLPLWVAAGSGSAIIHAAPFTLEWIMRLAMGGAFITAGLSLTMLPPRPKTVKATAWIVMIFQWLLLPITFTVFGAAPAIDAQTRLMLGKYLGFNVTKKVR